jgi:hypothetical protein
MQKTIETLATIGTLAGFYLIGRNPELGYTVAGFSNLLWIIWAMPKKAVGIIIVNVIMLAISVLSLI